MYHEARTEGRTPSVRDIIILKNQSVVNVDILLRLISATLEDNLQPVGEAYRVPIYLTVHGAGTPEGLRWKIICCPSVKHSGYPYTAQFTVPVTSGVMGSKNTFAM